MKVVNGNTMLRIGGRALMPGETRDVEDTIAARLIKAGFVQQATQTPRTEKAVMPSPEELTYKELRAELKKRDLATGGNKSQMLKRLREEG